MRRSGRRRPAARAEPRGRAFAGQTAVVAIALATGSSSGMGLHTAIGLAQRGLHVLAGVRDPDRADALRDAASAAGVPLEVVELDVTDPEHACEVVERAGSIDVLVNNAGRGSVATLEQLSDADLQQQLEVNFIAVARLTRLVLPGMRARGSGRIVTVTSVGGLVGQPFADAYCAAKFAVEGLMQSLAPVAARFGVGISVVEPAAVASSFVDSLHLPASPRTGDPYGQLQSAYLRRSSAAFRSAQPAEEAAAVIIEAATTAAPRFRWQTSPTASAFAALSTADLTGSRVLDITGTWLD